MSVQTEYVKLVVDAKGGKQALADFQTSLNGVTGSVQNLNALYAKGLINEQQYTDGLKDHAKWQAELNQQIKITEQVMAGKASKSYGQGILQASFALQDLTAANGDLQRALYNVQNNIPVVINSLTGNASLAGAISAVSIGIGLALPHITEWIKEMGLLGESSSKATTQIEKLEEQIKELEEKPFKLTVDQTELDNAKRKLKEIQTAQQAFDQFKGTKSDEERAAGDQIEELIKLAPGGASNLADKLRQSMGNQLLANDQKIPEFQKRLVQARAESEKLDRVGASDPAAAQAALARRADLTKEIAEIEEELRRRRLFLIGDEATGTKGEAHTEVGKLFQGATSGDPAAAKRFVTELNKIGQTGLARDIAATTPQSVAVANAEELRDKQADSAQETDAFIRKLQSDRKKAAEESAAKSQALVYEFEDPALGDKALKEQLAKKNKGDKVQKELDKGVIGRRNAEENASIKSSGVDVMAAELLGRVRSQGGDLDSSGNFRRIAPEDQFAYVQSQAAQFLHRPIGQDQYGRPVRANPGMNAEQTQEVAGRITAQGSELLNQQMASLAGQNLTETQKLQQSVANLQSVMAGLQGQLRSVQANGRAIDRGTRQLYNNNQAYLNFSY